MDANQHSLKTLGWKHFFQRQLTDEDEGCIAARVGSDHGSEVVCLTAGGDLALPRGLLSRCGDLAVGEVALGARS